MAGPTIEFKGGGLSDEEVRSYYLRAKGFLFPGEEDFGITPSRPRARARRCWPLPRRRVRERAARQDRLLV